MPELQFKAAIPTEVPPGAHYITNGKAYPITAFFGDAFQFRNDGDGLELGRVTNCAHGCLWEFITENG